MDITEIGCLTAGVVQKSLNIPLIKLKSVLLCGSTYDDYDAHAQNIARVQAFLAGPYKGNSNLLKLVLLKKKSDIRTHTPTKLTQGVNGSMVIFYSLLSRSQVW